jgi:hypothetical protein
MPKNFLYGIRMLIPDYEHRPIKIGFTTSPEQRFASYQGSGPFPYEWIGQWPARKGKDDERAAHEKFATYRLKGEWFFPAPEIVGFVESNVKAYVELVGRRTKNYEQEIKRARKYKERWFRQAREEAYEEFTMSFEGFKFRTSLCPGCAEEAKRRRVAERGFDSEAATERIKELLKVPLPRWMVEEEAAEVLGVSPLQLKQWRFEGVVPYQLLAPRTIRYSPRNLLEFATRQ